MKNLKIGLMLFMVVLASGSSMALGILKVDVIPGEKEKALVNVLVAPHSQFEVELKDSNGKIVYTDSKESHSYNCKKLYDFSELASGKYTFEVKLGGQTEMENLVVNNGKVQIVGQEDQISPYFSLNGKFLEFTFPNSEQKSGRLLLYDNDTKHWIFQERLFPEFDIQQALNLSKLNSGSYKAVLINGTNAYDYDFQLD